MSSDVKDRTDYEQDYYAWALENAERRVVPQWLELDKANYKGQVKVMPSRSDITAPIQEQLIVELYSK